MKIDEAGFHAVLEELTEENALACRGLLGISRLEFTNTVPTAEVSLEARPVLRVNLEFVRAHCDTEAHVKALLLHEFLHMLLRHTLEIRRMTPAVNIALDAVINAIIDRKLGPNYSSFMGRFYRSAEGALLLLRRLTAREQAREEKRHADQEAEAEWTNVPTTAEIAGRVVTPPPA